MLGQRTKGAGAVAKGKLDRIERELSELRQRRSSTDWHSDTWDADTRLGTITSLLAEYPEEIEFRRHAIVSSIAALQSFHRGFLIETMAGSREVMLRVSELVGEKYSLRETLDYIGAGRISAQELIAHLAPDNNVDDVMTWLGRVVDADFENLLAKAVPPLFRQNVGDEGAARIVEDVPALLSALRDLFRLRHILAHEAAPTLQVTQEDTLRLIGAVRLWIDGVRGVLWMTLWRDEPLTTMEMNIAAYESVQVARSRLAQAMKRLRFHLRGKNRRNLTRNHRAWVSHSRELVDIAYGRRQGSMWKSVAASVSAELFTERAAHIDGWAGSLDPH